MIPDVLTGLFANVHVSLDPNVSADNVGAQDLLDDIQAAIDAALVSAGRSAGEVFVVLGADRKLDLLAVGGTVLLRDETAEEALEGARRYFADDFDVDQRPTCTDEILTDCRQKDFTTSVALADIDGDGDLDLVVANVGIDLRKMIEDGLVQIADLVEDATVAVEDLVSSGLVTLIDLVESELLDRFDFDQDTILPLIDLINSGASSLDDLADAGIANLDSLAPGATIPAADLIGAGLVTPAELAAAGLPTSGPVPVSDLIDSNLVTLEELVSSGFIAPDDLVSGAATTLGQLINRTNTTIQDLIQAGIIELEDLVQEAIDARELIRSRLADLRDLIDEGLIDIPDLGDLDFDPREIASKYAVGAPSRVYVNIDNPLTAAFEGFAVPVDLESRITKAVALADINGDNFVDVITANVGTPVRAYLNNGSGGFGAGTDLTPELGLISTSLVVTDLDGDLDNDLVVGNLFETNRAYLNNGSGSFGAASAIGADRFATTSIAVGDINGDDRPDVIAGNSLPSIGLAGSISWTNLVDRARAEIKEGAEVNADTDVRVIADGHSDVISLAGASADAVDLSVGISANYTHVAHDVFALIDSSTVEAGRGFLLSGPAGVLVDATATDDILSFASGSVSGSELLGIAASIALTQTSGATGAFIRNATVTTDNPFAFVPLTVHVRASRVRNALSVAGATATAAGLASVGAAVAAVIFGVDMRERTGNEPECEGSILDCPPELLAFETTDASIVGSTVVAKDHVIVEVFSVDDVEERAAGLSAALGFGIAGSVTLAGTAGKFRAGIDGGTVEAGGNVIVATHRSSTVDTFAGAAAAGLAGGIGAAISGVLDFTQSEAFLGENADVKARGNTAPSVVQTDRDDAGNPVFSSIRGLSVSATARHEASPIAVGAGASVLLGLAGSFLFTVLAGSAIAAIRPGARFNQFDAGDPGAHLDQTVSLLSDHVSVVDGLSGAAGAGVLAGVGLAVDAGVVVSRSEASAGGLVDSNTDITIRSRSTERLSSFAGAISIALVGALQTTVAGWLVAPTTRSSVSADGDLGALGHILVSARDDSSVDLDAGVRGLSPVATVGAAITAVSFYKTTEAFVAADAKVTANGTRGPPITAYTGDRSPAGVRTTVAVRGLAIEAIAFDSSDSLALGAAISGLVGIAASATAHHSANTTRAFVDSGAEVNSQDNSGSDAAQRVRLLAWNETDLGSFAGALSASSLVGVGAGVGGGYITKNTEAFIAPSATVVANRLVELRAQSDEDILSVAGSANLAGFIGVSAAVSGYYLTPITKAHIDGVVTAPDVMIGAEAETVVDQVAVSAITGSGITGGAAATGVLSAKTTEAYVGSTGQVNAAGNSGGIATFDAGSDGEPVAVTVRGLAIRALNHDEFLSVAIGGGGAPVVNVAASAVAHATDNTTRAYIDGGARVNEGNPASAGALQDVDILAFDHTDIVGIAGGVSISSIVGIGASATGGNIQKLTEAFIGPGAQVEAVAEVGVRAVTHEDVLGITGTVSIDEVVGIVGAGSGYRFPVTTRARITGADVESGGNVVVAADADTEATLVQGTLAGGAPISVGVSAGGVLLEKVTEAYIDGNATVDAFAGGAASQVATGGFGLSFDSYTGAMRPHISQIPAATDTPIPDSVVTGVESPISSAPPADQQLSGARNATPLFSLFRGVAVTATNRDNILVIAVGVGVSNGLSIPVSGAADVSMSETRAFVAGGAQVNAAGSTSDEQDVRIVAAHDHSYVAVSGSLTGFGTVDVTPAVSIGLIRNRTEAFVQSATVKATADITIQAKATEDVIAIAAVVTGDEAFSIAGSATAFAIDNLTRAFITGAATVTAQGTVAVVATDESNLTLVAGAIEASNAVGVGASLGVAMVVKDTRAFIDGNSSVDGKALGGDGFAAYDGDVPVDGAFPTHTVHGVVVQAFSLESIVNVNIAGTGAATVALVGAASVTIVDADTTAFIGDAQINHLAGADADQDVVVAAVDDVDIFSAGGAGVIKTTVAIGAAADVGIIRNDVAAFIAGGADVRTSRGIDVLALARKSVLAFSVSLNGTTVGLAGAVSMWTIGSFADGEGRAILRTISADGGPITGFPDLAASVDDMLGDLVDALADALASDHSTPSAGGTFNSATGVDGGSDQITLSPGHGFLAGDAAVYTAPDGDDPVGGLESGRTYFVGLDPNDSNKITLHSTSADAIAGHNAHRPDAGRGRHHAHAGRAGARRRARRGDRRADLRLLADHAGPRWARGGRLGDQPGHQGRHRQRDDRPRPRPWPARRRCARLRQRRRDRHRRPREHEDLLRLARRRRQDQAARDARRGARGRQPARPQRPGRHGHRAPLRPPAHQGHVRLGRGRDAPGRRRRPHPRRGAHRRDDHPRRRFDRRHRRHLRRDGDRLRAQPRPVVRGRGRGHRRGRRRPDRGDRAQHGLAQRLRAEPELDRRPDVRVRPQRLVRAGGGAAERQRRRRRRQRDRAEHQRLRDDRELVRLREHRARSACRSR